MARSERCVTLKSCNLCVFNHFLDDWFRRPMVSFVCLLLKIHNKWCLVGSSMWEFHQHWNHKIQIMVFYVFVKFFNPRSNHCITTLFRSNKQDPILSIKIITSIYLFSFIDSRTCWLLFVKKNYNISQVLSTYVTTRQPTLTVQALSITLPVFSALCINGQTMTQHHLLSLFMDRCKDNPFKIFISL